MESLKSLERLAKSVLELKSKTRPRRPIIVEFSGSPRSGKTTCIESMSTFLKRNGFKLYVLDDEEKRNSTFNKHNPTYNISVLVSAINKINDFVGRSYKENTVDVIFIDRGIFDTLCWLSCHKKNKFLSEEEFNVLTKFAVLDRWRENIDIVFSFYTEPEVSIKREYKNLLTKKPGSIMNLEMLNEYNEAIISAREKYSDGFKIYDVDTSYMTQLETIKEVTEIMLVTLHEDLIEIIGYIDKKKVDIKDGFNDFNLLSSDFENNFKYDRREKVEKNMNLYQIIPIAIFITKDGQKILTIKKKNNVVGNKSPERGKNLFYVGGHVSKKDIPYDKEKTFLNTICNTLRREVLEELNLAIGVSEPPDFVLYSPDNEKSKQHVAIGWVIEVNENINIELNGDELVSRNKPFVKLCDLNNKIKLESWSLKILDKFFGKRFYEPLDGDERFTEEDGVFRQIKMRI